MTNDLYTLDEDIANNNFIDCVQNAEADLNTDLPLQEYCYDPFEEIDASSTVTSWKDIKCVCSRVEFDGVSKDLLKNVKSVVPKVLSVCQNKIRENVYEASPSSFLNLFLNRDFYIVMQDYLKDRMEFNTLTNDTPTFDEILEMVRVWILQFVFHQKQHEI